MSILESKVIRFIPLILCLFSFNAFSTNDCSSLFTDGLQTHGIGLDKNIEFKCGSKLVNNPDTSLVTNAVVNPVTTCSLTCTTSNCVATGTPIASVNVGSFKNQSGGGDVTVNSGQNVTIGSVSTTNFDDIIVKGNGTLNFTSLGATTEYKLDKLVIRGNGVVNFVAGDYWIKQFTIRDDAKIKVTGSGTVRIFVKNKVNFGLRSETNYNSGVPNAAKQFFIYGYNVIRVKNNSKFVGFVYSKKMLDIDNDVALTGAALAENIEVGVNSAVTYDSTAKDQLDLSFANVFSDGLQTHSSSINKIIKFKCNGRLINNSDNTLATTVVESPAGACQPTCDSSNCNATGTTMATLDAGSFKAQSGGGDVTVNSGQNITIGSAVTNNFDDLVVKGNGTLNFSGLGFGTEYKIDKLDINGNGLVNFVAGNYWVNQFIIRDDAKINVIGSGTVRIFVNNQVDFGRRSEINYNSGVPNAAKQFFIYGFNKVLIKNDSKFTGFVYSKKMLEIDKRVQMTGAGLAENIEINDGSVVTYDSVAKTSLDLGFLCPVISGATHFVLNHAITGIYCFKHRVTVAAYQNSAILTGYNSTVVLDTSTGKGTWNLVTGNGAFNDATANDGQALYTFSASDNGVAVFDLDYTNGSNAVDIEVFEQLNSSIRDNDTSGNITFNLYGIVVSENAYNTSNPPEGQTYNAIQTAGIADNLHLTTFGQKTPAGVCGIINTYTGTKSLKFWQDYVDPNIGTLVYAIDSTSIGSTEGGAVATNVSFTNGEATVTSLYRDVGKIRINTKDEASSFPLRGSTSDFIVKPAKFALSVTGNPGALDANGAVFKKAGEAFTGTVTSQDNDGNTTPNFGNESTGETPEIISGTLVAPVGGLNGSNNDGAIGNGSNLAKIAPGVFESTTLSFDEVGIIKLTSRLFSRNYFGVAGDVASLETGNVGRFIPDHFDVVPNTPSLASAYSGLSSFSYLGQVIPYQSEPTLTITAKNTLGNTTKNYTGNFFKLAGTGISQNYATNSTQATFNSAAAESTNPIVQDNTNGIATITYKDGGGFVFEKVTSVNATAFNAEIELSTNIIDSDNVIFTTNPFKFGGTTTGTGIAFVGGNAIYHGRFNVLDNGGHEELPLSLVTQIEYFDGADFIINSLDDFTSFANIANISLTPDPAGLSTTASLTPIIGGVGAVTLSPPVGGTKGNVIVELLLGSGNANLPYLQYDWDLDNNQDGLFNDNPAGFATFGVYEGKKNIIFLEEITD